MIKKVIAASAATGGLLLASAGTTVADSGAHGAAVGSPGVLSGNLIQVPIHIPINVCGNTVDIVGFLNPAFGNHCANVGKRHHHVEQRHIQKKHHEPQQRHERPSHRHRPAAPRVVTPVITHYQHHQQQHRVVRSVRPQLAQTGAAEFGLAISTSAGLVVGGVLLYRRGRRAAARD